MITRKLLDLHDTLVATENAGLVVRYYQVMIVAFKLVMATWVRALQSITLWTNDPGLRYVSADRPVLITDDIAGRCDRLYPTTSVYIIILSFNTNWIINFQHHLCVQQG